jgi:hypothetical protein
MTVGKGKERKTKEYKTKERGAGLQQNSFKERKRVAVSRRANTASRQVKKLKK